jgi:hypothetical protein
MIARGTKTNTLTVKLGLWFEARAGGWGILALPVLALVLVAAAAARLVPL